MNHTFIVGVEVGPAAGSTEPCRVENLNVDPVVVVGKESNDGARLLWAIVANELDDFTVVVLTPVPPVELMQDKSERVSYWILTSCLQHGGILG